VERIGRTSETGFTIVELMVVVAIAGILAAVAVPVLRGRIDSAKWSEGKAMMGTLGTAIRAYHGNVGPSGAAPTALGVGNTGLGFAPGDLTGKWFVDADFSFRVTSMDPLRFTITSNPTTTTLNPVSYQLDESGNWTP
jgi:prepilin-type N-terminal cleavage/methylation domain-containing protein